ncbi:hypothetical protein, partial [Bacillus sp. JJ1764]|uniref:hypothetical protein n=1 Tax=Bacillus sp. JJ1764 TaxID=3122964 RepID=UPI002FFEBFD8
LTQPNFLKKKYLKKSSPRYYPSFFRVLTFSLSLLNLPFCSLDLLVDRDPTIPTLPRQFITEANFPLNQSKFCGNSNGNRILKGDT